MTPHAKRLLFLYMVPETGHQKAADAIIKAVSYMDPRVECVGLDGVSQAYPLLGHMVNHMYLQLLKTAPGIWDYLYDNPDIEEVTRDARGFLTLISSFRFRKILKEYQPLAVVCTQAVPAIALAAEKKRGHLKIPLICVVTDFGVHTYWHHDEVDLYLVAHDDLKKEMMARGIREERICVTGIPIMPDFGKTIDPANARTRLHMIPNKKTILIMGGSRGMGTMDQVVGAILNMPQEVQLAVVCGRNKSLFRKILPLKNRFNNLHVFGYVRNLSPLMSACDILITKPGGLTCSEALAKEIPMVLTNPLPGQEEKNVKFFLRHELAAFAQSQEDLVHTVADLLRHPKKLAAIKHRMRLVSKPHSAWEAARQIFDLIKAFDGMTPKS